MNKKQYVSCQSSSLYIKANKYIWIYEIKSTNMKINQQHKHPMPLSSFPLPYTLHLTWDTPWWSQPQGQAAAPVHWTLLLPRPGQVWFQAHPGHTRSCHLCPLNSAGKWCVSDVWCYSWCSFGTFVCFCLFLFSFSFHNSSLFLF